MKSYTHTIESDKIKKGSYLLINGNPCKILTCFFQKTGRHGTKKAYLCGVDIFTGDTYETIQLAKTTQYVPVVEKKNYKFESLYSEEEWHYVKVSNNEGEIVEFMVKNDKIVEILMTGCESNMEFYVNTICGMGIEEVTSVETRLISQESQQIQPNE
ncbi:predicted protein [Naegleria gruberi]|uniref:Predicted protein n=1 Tax=Naegleria gruberi TaxID=5762 RepID=D2V8F6_NAEGR|nr:uncharacterized protein NAEGRDRAFT_32007 [Naegleria gruberi]EFC46800.1 predicted protein [Naegleria gruberi]|eukprot:XP_002679544.1 predicted protein [Naegleria gruberi strain NEG-M]